MSRHGCPVHGVPPVGVEVGVVALRLLEEEARDGGVAEAGGHAQRRLAALVRRRHVRTYSRIVRTSLLDIRRKRSASRGSIFRLFEGCLDKLSEETGVRSIAKG